MAKHEAEALVAVAGLAVFAFIAWLAVRNIKRIDAPRPTRPSFAEELERVHKAQGFTYRRWVTRTRLVPRTAPRTTVARKARAPKRGEGRPC